MYLLLCVKARVWNRGVKRKRSPPRNGHGSGTVLSVAEGATSGTGSLIKNAAPFQQLRLGPKWNRTVLSEEGDQREPLRRRYGTDVDAKLHFPAISQFKTTH